MSTRQLSRRVLVVDDDDDTRALMAMLVSALRPAAQVRTAANGRIGLALAVAWWPDLVITDIDMPLLSGIEAALQMRTELAGRALRIVAATGNPTWRTDPMALAVFDLVLLKPLDVETVRSLL